MEGLFDRPRTSCGRLTSVSYAGDITPEEAWKLLIDNPEAVLVDCRTDAEWRFVGVPDLSSPQRDVVYVEWNSDRRQAQRRLRRRSESAASRRRGPTRQQGTAGGVPVSLRQPLHRRRRGGNRGGHRPVLQRAGRIRGQPRRAQASRRHRVESRRPALEAVMSTRRRSRVRIAARNERGPERAGVEA